MFYLTSRVVLPNFQNHHSVRVGESQTVTLVRSDRKLTQSHESRQLNPNESLHKYFLNSCAKYARLQVSGQVEPIWIESETAKEPRFVIVFFFYLFRPLSKANSFRCCFDPRRFQNGQI